MGWNRRIACVVLSASVLCVSCKRREPLTAPSEPPGKPHLAEAEPAGPPLYDAHGRLFASKERVEWLEVPVGFARLKQREYGRHTIYESSRVPFDKLRDFLSLRMLTGRVEETSRDVVYSAVMPVDGRSDAARLNIKLTRLPKQEVQLDIERLGYGDVKPLSDEQAKKALRDEQQHAE